MAENWYIGHTTGIIHNFESIRERELKFDIPKHLEKMCLETKFQPFLFRNDKDIQVQMDVHVSNLTFLQLYLETFQKWFTQNTS